MGIRVHKVLGWGLTDIQYDKENWKIIDPRFNDASNSEAEKERRYEGPRHFIAWLKGHRKEAIQVLAEVDQASHHCCGEKDIHDYFNLYIHLIINQYEEEDKSIWSLCEFSPEYGEDSVMVFRPIDSTETYRYDNLIDYYEEGCGGENKVKKLEHCTGIWPWEGMEHIPGSEHYGSEEKTLTGTLLYPYTISGGDYNRLVGRWSKNLPPLVKGEYLEYLLTAYRPAIAHSVILYVYWLKIFKDFYKTIHEIRPMIYTYWG